MSSNWYEDLEFFFKKKWPIIKINNLINSPKVNKQSYKCNFILPLDPVTELIYLSFKI